MVQRYLIALGSNRRHQRHGPPEQVLRAALTALQGAGIAVLTAGPILSSAPLGPSWRRYANSAALIETGLDPDELLEQLKQIEAAFGRRSRGQRWTSRVLDLDMVLWSGGAWSDPDLTIPHREFRARSFVLRPALAVAPDLRDPITGLSLRQLYARLTRPRPIPR